MRVQHNIAAMNSYRIYNNNAGALGKNLEKLSSGYRINRAGDDAAGLAISQKMRAQITGLDAASKNVKDGISLVQTAEGAMQEVHDMLGRMKYLATQSANGTYQDDVDRDNLQKEVDSLLDEIDRIADTANFNGQTLLDGSLSSGAKKVSVNNTKAETIAATKGQFTLSFTGAATTLTQTNAGLSAGNEITFNVGLDDGTSYNVKLTLVSNSNGGFDLKNDKGQVVAHDDEATVGNIKSSFFNNAIVNELNKTGLKDKFDISAGTKASTAISFTAKVSGSNAPSISAAGAKAGSKEATIMVTGGAGHNAGKKVIDASVTKYTGSNAEDAIFTINGKKFVVLSTANMTTAAGLGSDVTVLVGTLADNADKISEVTGLTVQADTDDVQVFGSGDGNGLQLQIGDTGEKANKMSVKVSDMHAKALGLANLDISTADAANASIDRIKQAIDSVSSTRGDLGAVQNRLEHTSNNLSVMTENLQSAESTIRDTDVADEMMKYTKNNILLQSAQAMLAQANQLPQGVLQLLQ